MTGATGGFLSNLPASLQERVRLQEPMRLHTSFRIGGPADVFAEPCAPEEIALLIQAARADGLPVTVVGNGSNLLVSDRGIRGLVISLGPAYSGITPLEPAAFRALEAEMPGLAEACQAAPHTPLYADFGRAPTVLRVLAGTSLTSLAVYAREEGLAGLEFACGIPGSVGGGVYMNAGAYGNSIEDVVVLTRSMSWDGRLHWTCGTRHDFAYRSSYFSQAGHIILESYFCLRPGNPEEIAALQADYRNRRRSTQPLELPSAGSMFKRPKGYFAGTLIADAGLKGYRVGDAAISEKHAGFLVNLGSATAQDVRELVQFIQRRIFDACNVSLETEVRFLGDWD